MADSTPARLKVILGENNIEKLSLPNGIPESLDDLLSQLKTFFGLKGDVRLQYMDQDFGNDFFNLNSTTQLQDLGTIKVIHQQTNTPLNITTDTTSSSSLECDGNVSLASDDTIILSSPESAYPDDSHFCTVAEALIKKHPCLKEPGSFNGCNGWKQRLKYKMGNYRTQLKLQGCPELVVNSLKSKAATDAFPAKKVKRPKRAEANFIHPSPLVPIWKA
ncbi:hypothetical protein F7725_007520 [Dissostichus mawsoni]|uniref:PB1 domain-containing protein n=1 Tax=Dissostichus mawsoni TaxID=36200 RepID=A0A7J5Y6V8_DISMA|nr:hypothetical protein F7725_007520 [Dissostichus mawsoni]